MARKRGSGRALSPFRRMVIDVLHFAAGVPQIPMERIMRLAPLVEARCRAEPKPGWCAIFAKAFALVAVRRPELRDVYLSFPWDRLYRYESSAAAIIIERDVNGENALLNIRLDSPEDKSLAEIEASIRNAKTAPLNEISSFRRSLRMAKYPRPLRRAMMWLAFRCIGKLHQRYIGNFSLSVVAGLGAGQLSLVSAMTANIHYGVFEKDGSLPVRLSFDHRVIDAGDVARAMVELERVLLTTILEELEIPAGRLAA